MTGYSVSISAASKELTARERIMFKDFTNAVALDDATKEASLVITPAMWVVLDVHNEKSDNKDYKKYIVVDTDGTKYVTGSDNFFDSFKDIVDEMCDTGEDYQVEIYQVESKNYKGKTFITCSIC